MEYGFVDCHCHISAREFEEVGTKKITQQAEKRSANLMRHSFSCMQNLIQYPDLVAPSFGIHPVQGGSAAPPLFGISLFINDVILVILLFLLVSRLVWTTPWCAPTQQDRDDQTTVFVKQLDIAKELDLPVNVHSRSAAKVTTVTMRERGVSRAPLHHFAGTPSVALEGVKAGYFFSFPPAVCRNQQRDKLIGQIPLEHICLETDSPALGLEQHVRNEPGNIALSCHHIANIKGLSPQTVQLITAQNAERLFPKANGR
uniref:TatD DNase domain containing 3 n=1 Tax=Mola mola TaxID=94237 RepID=A0A3Q4BL29_MOLML